MVSAPPSTCQDLQTFLLQPETKPAREWWHGRILEKPMPQGKHSLIQGELIAFLNHSLKPQRLALALPELRCTFAGRSIVPDIAVITWEHLPVDPDGTLSNTITFCPQWLIEILSPEQPQTYLIRKILDSFDHGCEMGWLIDPQAQAVLCFSPPGRLHLLDDPSQALPMPAWAKDISLTVGTLFGWMQVKLS